MSEEKIVYIPTVNIPPLEACIFLFIKEYDVVGPIRLFLNPKRQLTSLTIYKIMVVLTLFSLIHIQHVSFLQDMVLTSDKNVSKNNFEVNL